MTTGEPVVINDQGGLIASKPTSGNMYISTWLMFDDKVYVDKFLKPYWSVVSN